MKIQPYLFFDGRCEEAIEFYRKHLAATLTALMRFRESPEPQPPGMLKPGMGDKVMHASLRVGSTEIMASDGGMCHDSSEAGPSFRGFSLTASVPTEADADRVFTGLAEGGRVQMPLARTFFSPRFGMVLDKFGVSWMVIVGQ